MMIRRLNPIRCILRNFSITKRCVHLEVRDYEIEKKLTLENFDENFDKLVLPFKLRRFPDESKKYVRMRLQEFKDGYKPITVEQYSSLYENVDSEEEKQKIIQNITMIVLYYNKIISKSLFSPREITVEDMKSMLYDYHKLSARFRFVHFIFVREFDQWRRTEIARREKEIRKEIDRKELEEIEEVGCFDTNNELQYGFFRNTIVSKYYEKAVQHYSLHRLRQAEMFGQPFVVDCSFDETMADYEMRSVARQISTIYNENRFSRHPFKLLFTGYNPENRGFKYTTKALSSIINDPKYIFNFRHETYRELCPNERLIYLSPDSRRLMREFDPNAVYIVGALVSKTMKSQMTFEKARAEGLETLRLPIHEYVRLKPGVKRVLSFSGVFQILLHLKEHGDWERALRAGIKGCKLADD